MAHLTEKQKAMIRERRAKGDSRKDIADDLGCTEATVIYWENPELSRKIKRESARKHSKSPRKRKPYHKVTAQPPATPTLSGEELSPKMVAIIGTPKEVIQAIRGVFS